MFKRAIFAAVVMLCAASLLLAGCAREGWKGEIKINETPAATDAPTATGTPGSVEIDWTMRGAVVNSKGDFAGSVPVTIRGVIENNYPDEDKASLEIAFQNNFHIMCKEPEGGYTTNNRKTDGLAYPVFHAYGYDSYTNAPVFCGFAIDLEKAYFIMNWDDGSGQYLVASQNPDVTSEEILEHFQGFIEWYSYKGDK